MIFGAGLNGHVGMSGRNAASRGNRGFGERNDEGDCIVGFADTFDLVIANSPRLRGLRKWKASSSAGTGN